MNNSYITIIKEKRTALSRKRIPLNQNGCTANFRIGVPFEQNLQCISAFDLNVILGNLTENAIEAAEQTKDKWMSVDIYYEKGMLSMEIKNSFQHELAVEKNKLLSTKEEKGHGIGLANVRKMVEKYQGFMDVSNTNQIFIVKVMLYL